MLAKCFVLNPKEPYVSLEKEKLNVCAVLTYSIKGAREIRKFHVAVVQQRPRNVQKSVIVFFVCQSKPIAFLLFAVAVAKTLRCCDPEILLPW